MRIRAPQSRRQQQRITLNLASMIDVTFLLLIYFMVTMVLISPEDRLSPTLQTIREETPGAVGDFQPQVIEVVLVQGAPAYRLGGRTYADREGLLPALRTLPKGPGVFVKVFDQIPVGFAIAALQIARDAGFEQVTYVSAQR
jgi:biopolymer transport protein ExbD